MTSADHGGGRLANAEPAVFADPGSSPARTVNYIYQSYGA